MYFEIILQKVYDELDEKIVLKRFSNFESLSNDLEQSGLLDLPKMPQKLFLKS